MVQLRPWARAAFVGLCVLFVLACSGGGCSGCEGCGVAPIPGGYPIAARIENAAQIRLSQSGVAWIESNVRDVVGALIGPGIDFPIPTADLGFGFTVCPGGGCNAHIEIDALTLDPQAPNRLQAHIRVVADSRDAGGARRAIPVGAVGPDCTADLDTRRGGRDYVGLNAAIDFVADTHAARNGYTKLQVSSVDLDPDEGVEGDDVDISGPLFSVCTFDIAFHGFIIGLLEDRVRGMIQGALDEQLCTRRGELGCPTGTFARPTADSPDSICRYENRNDAECVPMLLGADGRGDLGAAWLSGISPGAHAPGQFLLASGGDGEAINEGMSLFMYGGFQSLDRSLAMSPGHNACVPLVEPPDLPTIRRVDSFRGNVIPGTTTETHLGVGISEQFLNYAGYGVFDSGLLCLGVGTRTSQQISTGLFSLLIASLKDLTFPETNAPIAIALRPQTPPVFEVGKGDASEPLLQVTLDQLSLDFYVWSTERYIRFMTYTGDVTLDVRLEVESGQIVPVIDGVVAANSTITNNELLAEDADSLATTLETLLGMYASMLTSGIGGFAVPSFMGFDLSIPDGGIAGVDDGGEEFLGIFANLSVAGAMPLTATPVTSIRVEDVDVPDPRALALETWGRGTLPSARLVLDADGPSGVDYEYSYRLDGMSWSAWAPDREIVVRDRALLFQARHNVEARARIAGQPRTADLTPATGEILIDVLAPSVELVQVDGGVRADASDVLSPPEALRYRFKVGSHAWTEWSRERVLAVAVDQLDEPASAEVRDEAGNVGAVRSALIRGLPDPTRPSSCNCTVPGTSHGSQPLAWIGALALFGIAWGRRRRLRRSTSARGGTTPSGSPRPSVFSWIASAALLLGLGAAGCDCGGDDRTTHAPCDGMCADAVPPGTAGSKCCPTTNMCVAYDLDALCMPGYTCASLADVTFDSCMPACTRCTVKPPLEEGLLATHLDMAVSSDLAVFVSGYAVGVPPMTPYGDLVVGEYDESTSEVAWEIVDGAPSTPVTADPTGWRDGVAAPGDDVGMWTSIATSASGDLYVSYYDATNGALKLARGKGETWTTQVVDDTGDSGRYSSLVLDSSGSPVIAYLRMEPSTDMPGRLRSSVQVAAASSAMPAAATDWTISEITKVDGPCRPAICDAGDSCLETGSCVTPTADCAETCATGTVCFMATCEAALPDNYVEDMPVATGLYDSLAVTPAGELALVFYDRTAGNVYGASTDAGTWGAPFLIDGYGRGDPYIGDSGIGASLAIDASGVWHVTYVDGAEESLRYARVEAGVVTTEMVDDGSTDGTMRYSDGRHIVGDDSSVGVTDAGEIRIVYQDATAHRTMLARRAAGGSEWTKTIFDMEDHTGFWLEQQLVGTTSYVAAWWRGDTRSNDNGVRVLFVE